MNNEGGLDNLFKFEWEIEIFFDSLDIKKITGLALKLDSVEMDSDILKEDEKENQKKLIYEALQNMDINNLDISLIDVN
jgi:hypothetical protein